MKITGKQQAILGRKVKAMKAAGYSDKEIVTALQQNGPIDFLALKIEPKNAK